MLGVHWEGLRLSLYVFCCRLIKVSFLSVGFVFLNLFCSFSPQVHFIFLCQFIGVYASRLSRPS